MEKDTKPIIEKTEILDNVSNNNIQHDEASYNKVTSLLLSDTVKYKPKNRYELKELLKDENIKLASIDVSLIKNVSYIFKGTNRKDFEGIESWKVPKTVLQYNTFKDTPIENNPPSWYYDNPPEILYTPESKEELQQIIFDAGSDIYLGSIDVSKITDLLDVPLPCNGLAGIEYWDVSNVEDMYTFGLCNDNMEIGHWDVSNVDNFIQMFSNAVRFNQDLSSWGDKLGIWEEDYKPSEKVISVYEMFANSPLEDNPPQWYKALNYINTRDDDEYDV